MPSAPWSTSWPNRQRQRGDRRAGSRRADHPAGRGSAQRVEALPGETAGGTQDPPPPRRQPAPCPARGPHQLQAHRRRRTPSHSRQAHRRSPKPRPRLLTRQTGSVMGSSRRPRRLGPPGPDSAPPGKEPRCYGPAKARAAPTVGASDGPRFSGGRGRHVSCAAPHS